MLSVVISGNEARFSFDLKEYSDAVLNSGEGRFMMHFYYYGTYYKSISLNDDNAIVKLDKPGVYKVNIKYKSADLDQAVDYIIFEYYPDSVEHEYKEFLSSELCLKTNPICFYQYKYPFCDFALLIDCYLDDDIVKRLFGKNMQVNRVSDTISIISEQDLLPICDGNIIFSGVCNTEKRFVYGSEDIFPDDCIDDYLEAVGNASYVFIRDGKITCGTDYFGMHSLYYYTCNGKTIISNRYHMLLKLVSGFNERLHISDTFIYTELYGANIWNNYPPGDNTLWREISVLPMGKRFVYDGSLKMVDTDMWRVLTAPKLKSHEEYIELLDKARDEILWNVKAPFDSKRFSKYSMELTGGMDSRYGFAAAMSLEEGKNLKILNYINSTDDFFVPLTMADSYNLDYDFENLYSTNKEFSYNSQSFSEMLDRRISIDMHRQIDTVIAFAETYRKDDTTLIMDGAAGEISTREFMSQFMYSFDYLIKNPKKQNEETMDEMIVNNNIMSGVIVSDEKVIHSVADYITGLIRNCPAKAYCEKYENMLLYRSRYHFTATKNGGYDMLHWSPAISKYAFEAFVRTIGKRKFYQFGFDLMYKLNSNVHGFAYKNKKYEMMRDYCADGSVYSSNDYEKKEINKSTERYEAQKQAYLKDHVPKAQDYATKFYTDNRTVISDKNKFLKMELLEKLFTLLHFVPSEVESSLGKNLYHFIKYQASDFEIKYYYLRISDLLAQINEVIF